MAVSFRNKPQEYWLQFQSPGMPPFGRYYLAGTSEKYLFERTIIMQIVPSSGKSNSLQFELKFDD